MTIGRAVKVTLAELNKKSWQLKDYGVGEKVHWMSVSIHPNFVFEVEALFQLAVKELSADVSVFLEDKIYVSFVASNPVEDDFFQKLPSAVSAVIKK